MSIKSFYATTLVILMFMLMTMLCGCGRKNDEAEIVRPRQILCKRQEMTV